jgi:hypothetical protein
LTVKETVQAFVLLTTLTLMALFNELPCESVKLDGLTDVDESQSPEVEYDTE